MNQAAYNAHFKRTSSTERLILRMQNTSVKHASSQHVAYGTTTYRYQNAVGAHDEVYRTVTRRSPLRGSTAGGRQSITATK